ncbi:hypothetical protein FVEG_01069 [Fusarium verticillioides 7600]|uniref:Uncharacterized protein n=1 Tax=Gibberella moniliformis (strain M3125 / FGSC 7600) TaxID=334819 RepID=W7LPQ8_GIBM7|nr:hypothetical protein FVEG_01069 [Fusarium verticillioides 7600]EWG37475.1 hypothetical protein FVEG_01069 [Fusarium verticillioides 7600]RBQ95822.1 hypothetical protein FVER53263_01069 [Fusarium verticillioides]
MPFHERTRDSSVAGRQQDQCPQIRGGWEKLVSYLIWPHWCITRLIRWLFGASSPDHLIPESRSTWGTWAFSMRNLPSEAPIARIPLRPNRYHLAGLRDQEDMARESHGQPHSPPTARSLDFSSLGYVENGYFIPPTSHFDKNGPTRSSSHRSSTSVHPSQDKAIPLTAETVRWPFLSSPSEDGEASDEESEIEMKAVTPIAKLPGSFLPSSEPSDNSDQEFHGRIGTAASPARVFINRRRDLPITAGGFCEALQLRASVASGFPAENFSSDPVRSLNASSPAIDVASTIETTEDRYEGEDEEDED